MELSTGPLGLGLSAGLGMAMADRIKGLDAYTYVVMGDGEIEAVSYTHLDVYKRQGH